MRQHPGMSYVTAFREVMRDDNSGDLAVRHYREHGTSAEVEQLRGLEGRLQHEAGRLLHEVTDRRVRRGGDPKAYAEALRAAAARHPEAGRAYGIEEPKVERPWYMR
jgi:hypothetical protein